MCKSPWHTGPHGQVFGLVCYFPKGFDTFTSVHEFFDLTPNVKERMAHLQIVFYQPKFSDVIPIVGTTYLISKNVIHDGFPHWHTEYIQVLRQQFSFLQPITLPIHICACTLFSWSSYADCNALYRLSVLNLTQSVVNRMAHHQLWPLEDQESYMSFSLRYFYEILTRSLRDLYEIWILQGKAAGQGSRDLFYSSLLCSRPL